jgi:hypothetical protein
MAVAVPIRISQSNIKERATVKKHLATLIGGIAIGVAVLTASNGLLAAQESTPASDEAGMMQMATPAATDAEMVAEMEEMMDQCLAMMKMMSAMMGGDMSGMMGDEGMSGMMGMGGTPETAATPDE